MQAKSAHVGNPRGTPCYVRMQCICIPRTYAPTSLHRHNPVDLNGLPKGKSYSLTIALAFSNSSLSRYGVQIPRIGRVCSWVCLPKHGGMYILWILRLKKICSHLQSHFKSNIEHIIFRLSAKKRERNDGMHKDDMRRQEECQKETLTLCQPVFQRRKFSEHTR